VKPESSAPPTLPADVDAKSSAGAPPRSLTHPRPTTARSRSEGSGTADRPGRSRRLSHAAASAPKQSYRGRPSALSLWTTGTRLAVTPTGCRFARLKQAWSRRWARCSGLVLGSSQIRWAAGYRSRRGSRCHVPVFRGKGAFGMACRGVQRREQSGSRRPRWRGRCCSQGKGRSWPPLRIAARQPFDIRARVWLRPGGLVASRVSPFSWRQARR
jgi:hypothetical protein